MYVPKEAACNSSWKIRLHCDVGGYCIARSWKKLWITAASDKLYFLNFFSPVIPNM